MMTSAWMKGRLGSWRTDLWEIAKWTEKTQRALSSVEEMIGRFTSELVSDMPDWRDRLATAPEQLESIERDVHTAFARGADLLIAGLIAVVMKRADFLNAAQQTRRDFSQPLGKGRERTVKVKLLGGLVIVSDVDFLALLSAPKEVLSQCRSDKLQFVY